jgi:hypothetical protein
MLGVRILKFNGYVKRRTLYFLRDIMGFFVEKKIYKNILNRKMQKSNINLILVLH